MVPDQIDQIRTTFETELDRTKTSGQWDELYLKYFSKTHGVITNLMKELPKLDSAQKREVGPKLNQLSNDLKTAIESGKANWQKNQTEGAQIDLTYPLPPAPSGMCHPTTQVIRGMNDFFRYHGFSVAEGPEIETAEYNFRKLNLPEGHPATDLQDTLFVHEPDLLLRTHTSSVESRVLTNYKPPIRMVAPGKCYRNETPSLTNGSFFYQYQGVVVDKGITIQHLKWTLEQFHKYLYGDDVILRFRYKYYPEVTPGMGTDIQCPFCHGEGCPVCKQRGWIEVLGSGMIHPNTLRACKIDPEVYTGFAFGIGLDRMVMSKFGVKDIRKLYGGGMVYA